jgi:hypothetical protein
VSPNHDEPVAIRKPTPEVNATSPPKQEIRTPPPGAHHTPAPQPRVRHTPPAQSPASKIPPPKQEIRTPPPEAHHAPAPQRRVVHTAPARPPAQKAPPPKQEIKTPPPPVQHARLLNPGLHRLLLPGHRYRRLLRLNNRTSRRAVKNISPQKVSLPQSHDRSIRSPFMAPRPRHRCRFSYQ